ncbi:MAG: CPBP family intramembrane glutamic endopeptidase [Trueperaceae bacterium]|nr:CPBP family intramembrane glutamic endopeptidase [Trueperaceae bacterium]
MPSLALGLVGAVWVWLRPPAFEAETGLVGIVLAGSLTAAGLLAGAWGLEHLLPSFRRASRLLERALSRVPLSLPVVVGLALATSVSEELLFRGALLAWLGVWPQALLFGLFHPVPLRAWGYQAYTVVAGLVFGYLTVATGSLWAALLAHFVVNVIGLGQVWRTQRDRRQRQFKRRQPKHDPKDDSKDDDATPSHLSP